MTVLRVQPHTVVFPAASPRRERAAKLRSIFSVPYLIILPSPIPSQNEVSSFTPLEKIHWFTKSYPSSGIIPPFHSSVRITFIPNYNPRPKAASDQTSKKPIPIRSFLPTPKYQVLHSSTTSSNWHLHSMSTLKLHHSLPSLPAFTNDRRPLL